VAPSILAADLPTLQLLLAASMLPERTGCMSTCLTDVRTDFAIGPPVVASLRKHSGMFLDCHRGLGESDHQRACRQRHAFEQQTLQCCCRLFSAAAVLVLVMCPFMHGSMPRHCVQGCLLHD